MTTLSLCMIVKNEEANLSRCLRSVRDWVDEIIVVDTGSTDRTVALAESYGARVFHHPWEDDFSKHRNQSMAYASGDWILIMDADEELAEGHGAKLQSLLSACPSDVTKIYFLVKNVTHSAVSMVSTSLRLFRNHIGAHYRGIVHNLLVVPQGERYISDTVLYHYGYDLSPELMEKKFRRTHDLLTQQLRENPHDLYALYNMATTWYPKDPRMCIEYGFRLLSCLKQKGDAPLFYINIFYVLATSYVRLKELDKAIDLCIEALSLLPEYLDAYWVLCETCFEKGDHPGVIRYGNEFLRCHAHYKDNPEALANLFLYSYDRKHEVRLRLGISSVYEDDWASAETHLRACLNEPGAPADVPERILGHLQSRHRDFPSIRRKLMGLLRWADSDKTTPLQDRPSFPGPEGTHADQPGTGPLISLCMIVKNEENMLPRCLDSVKDFIDEIVIVDTGSTDKTVEIAESYGAKVYHHPWENDFSKHRNQSISYAQGQWVLILDADEVLRDGDGLKLMEMAGHPYIDSVLVTVVNHFNQENAQSWANQVRMFRRDPNISYTGIVHNQLSGYRSMASCPVFVYHYGYDLNPELMQAKFERTSQLLRKKIEQDPGNFRHYHDLSVSYAMNRMFEESVSAGLKAIDMAGEAKEKGNLLILWTHFIVSSSLLRLGNVHEAKKYALDALNICPYHLDCNFILAMVYHKLGDGPGFGASSEKYLNILEQLRTHPETFGYMVNNTATEDWRIHLAGGDFCLLRGENAEAARRFERALSTSPSRPKCHQAIAGLYRRRGMLSPAEDHYRQAMAAMGETPETLLGTAMLCRAQGDHRKYREAMGRLRAIETDDEEVLTELGLCDLAEGRRDSAISLFNKAIHKKPYDPNIHMHLALAYKSVGRTDKAILHFRKVLSLRDDASEAMVQLGDIYFESRQYDDAAHVYKTAIDKGSTTFQVSLRWAWCRLLEGDAEGCVTVCDDLLRALNMPRRMILNDLQDLAHVFLIISQGLKEKHETEASNESLEMAFRLNPVLASSTS
jgi:glycosyltransferase involved in cell wall biosynthesis/Tfp pilus assembly protein PilF